MKKLLLLAAALLLAASAGAQQIRTSYFMNRTTVRTSLNPAFRPDQGFVSIPGVSAFAGFATNGVALGDLLYPRDGRLVTFMDASVPAEPFLSKLKQNNQINADFSVDVLSGGWYAGPGFWTVGIGLRGTVSSNIPKPLFEFMKLGSGAEGTTYDIKNLHAYGDSYVDVYVGYSRPVNDRLTIGGRYKFLVGAGNADAYFDRLTAVMNGDAWTITSQGRMAATAKGLSPKVSIDKEGNAYIDGFDYHNPGIGGYGSAIDLGVTYKILDDLTVSGAVLDLGFVCWNQQATVAGVADGTFDFDGFDLPIGNQSGNSVSDQMDDLTANLQELFHFRPTESRSRTTMLRSTINLGVEYSIAQDRLGFGLLSTTRFYKPKVYTELTASVNYRPIDWFAASLSYSFIHSDFRTFGFALNFSPSWINFFLGTDYMVTKVTPQFVPVKAHTANIYVGLGIPIGRNRRDAHRYRY